MLERNFKLKEKALIKRNCSAWFSKKLGNLWGGARGFVLHRDNTDHLRSEIQYVTPAPDIMTSTLPHRHKRIGDYKQARNNNSDR